MERLILGVCGMLAACLPGCGDAGFSADPELDPLERDEAVSAQELVAEISAPQVVATGLNSPRGIAIDASGTLYVAEAGVGGPGPCLSRSEGDTGCYGESGSITRIHRGVAKRVITTLPSIANADSTSVIGVHDVAIQSGHLYAVTGLGLDPAVRDPGGVLGEVAPMLGFLLRIEGWRGGQASAVPVADIAAFESANNPFPGPVESNPYGLLADGSRFVVADAAGNDLLTVGRAGTVSLLTTLPTTSAELPPPLPPGPVPVEPVPTAVVKGPDGALYVGELTGFPFPVGGARVFRIARGKAPEVYAEGFTNVLDIAFDCRGNLLVLEFAAQGLLSGNPAGALIRVKRDGTRETIGADVLFAPTSVAVAPRGEIYVSNCGACGPGQGSVVRVR